MKLRCFAVRDIKAEVFFPPVCHSNMAIAERWFGDLLRDSSTPLSQHPQDYSLYVIGQFETDTAVLEAEVAQLVCAGAEMFQVKAVSDA